METFPLLPKTVREEDSVQVTAYKGITRALDGWGRGEPQHNNDEFWKSKVSDARPFAQLTAGYQALPCNTCPNCLLWKRQLLSEQNNVRLSVNTWCCYRWCSDANLLKWWITSRFKLLFGSWQMGWLIDWLAGRLIVWYLYIAKRAKKKSENRRIPLFCKNHECGVAKFMRILYKGTVPSKKPVLDALL